MAASLVKVSSRGVRSLHPNNFRSPWPFVKKGNLACWFKSPLRARRHRSERFVSQLISGGLSIDMHVLQCRCCVHANSSLIRSELAITGEVCGGSKARVKWTSDKVGY